MKSGKSYTAKLLLFGEYSVLLGSQALSIPFPRFSARLSFSGNIVQDGQAQRSNYHLKKFLNYLENQPELFVHNIDLPEFKKDIASGLFFESEIPVSYGLGSSGALCAAVFGSYCLNPELSASAGPGEFARLRKIFSDMESFFHGKSSGFDPLVIYMNAPLRLDTGGSLSFAPLSSAFSNSADTLFLVDTGQPGRTGSLVPGFLSQFAPEGKTSPDGIKLGGLAGWCIDGLLNGDHELFRNSVRGLSALQLENFRPMIPDPMISLWKEGLFSGLFQLKLCGSGGGGYLLGLTQNMAETTRFFSSKKISTFPVILPF